MKYPCEACGDNKVTFAMRRYSPYCLPCQVVNNLVKEQPKFAEFKNKALMAQFHINQKEVDEKRLLPYWKKNLKN